VKHLVVCCDGTWKNEDDGSPSNVWKLYGLLAATDGAGNPQRAFYQPGVGADRSRSRLRRTASRVGGGAFGLGLDANILDAYRWLIREYEPGDAFWLFGFSRGAYTARSLAGLLRNCGLLRPPHEDRIKLAMALYRARDPSAHPDAPQSQSFRRNYSREVEEIRFLGVWDTVGALGVPSALGGLAGLWNRRYQFHDVQLSSRVKNACHALAIDEARPEFAPTLWRDDDPDGGTLESRDTVEQVWFIGSHSDVGGGYRDSGLSDLTLEWMKSKAAACGLRFQQPTGSALSPNPKGTIHDSRWGVHRLLGRALRREILPGARQFVHASALRRLADDVDYRPPNLEAAIRSGAPIAEG
jgi:uncharacterized protein (DUF2235 family)